MSKDIILKDKQTGYDIVAECVREHWKQTYYGTAIVWMAISYDGEKYCKSNEVVIPQDDNIEFLNDWWEGEKYIKIYGIANLDDIEMPTADVVEVVRCRDCVCFKQSTSALFPNATAFICDSPYGLKKNVSENDYCCHGERREK